MQGVPHGEAVTGRTTSAELLSLMDKRNLRTLVNLTGGVGSGLADSVRRSSSRIPTGSSSSPSRPTIASPSRSTRRGRPTSSARAKQAGAKGVKVLKMLGLFLRERVDTGPLMKVDDQRFDPMWEACGALGLPVAIHVSDPTAFFLPIDAHNERYEELQRHPDWSFHGKDYPSNAEILAARDRVLARHPKTTFIGLHVGHASEDLAAASAALDRFPNLHVEIAARIGELGGSRARRSASSTSTRTGFSSAPTVRAMRSIRSTSASSRPNDEYFDYSPGPVPSQGRWKIYGLGLSDQILKKVYAQNAERLLSLLPMRA